MDPPQHRSVRPYAVGDARTEDLIHVVTGAGVDGGIGEDVLTPHHVVLVDLRCTYRQLSPADAVEVIAGVGAHHGFGERGHALGGVRPGPRGGEDAEEPDLADLVVEDLMRV